METISATTFADRVIMAKERARQEHERIFGKKTFRQLGMMDDKKIKNLGRAKSVKVKNVKGKSRRKKREQCPHCATKNFVTVDKFTKRCTNCRFEQ